MNQKIHFSSLKIMPQYYGGRLMNKDRYVIGLTVGSYWLMVIVLIILSYTMDSMKFIYKGSGN